METSAASSGRRALGDPGRSTTTSFRSECRRWASSDQSNFVCVLIIRSPLAWMGETGFVFDDDEEKKTLVVNVF